MQDLHKGFRDDAKRRNSRAALVDTLVSTERARLRKIKSNLTLAALCAVCFFAIASGMAWGGVAVWFGALVVLASPWGRRWLECRFDAKYAETERQRKAYENLVG